MTLSIFLIFPIYKVYENILLLFLFAFLYTVFEEIVICMIFGFLFSNHCLNVFKYLMCLNYHCFIWYLFIFPIFCFWSCMGSIINLFKEQRWAFKIFSVAFVFYIKISLFSHYSSFVTLFE